MTRFPSPLATATVALAVAVLCSPNARAFSSPTQPAKDSTSGVDGCAEAEIPWIVASPESCAAVAKTEPVQPAQTGIHNLLAGGVPVFVDANGQLGTMVSSTRYKTDIANMQFDVASLLELRPVTFHYQADPGGPVQYGLIAEEVEKLFPDLVVRDADGKAQSVRYDELSSMLLKEVEAQQTVMGEQQKQLNAQSEKVEMQYHQLQAQDEQIRYLGDRVAQMQKLVEKLAKSSQ